MKSIRHRNKAQKHRNGRSRYEKGHRLHDKHPSKKALKGYRGSDTHNPEIDPTTLADVWPKDPESS